MKHIYVILTLLIAIPVLVIFLNYPGINDDKRSDFESMINGKAYKPFVYRMLVPTSVKFLSQMIPDKVKNSVSEFVENNQFVSKVFKKFRWESYLAIEYLIASLIMYLFLSGYAFLMKSLFIQFYFLQEKFLYAISIFALTILPPFFVYTSFLYDFSNLFFFTLGLLLLKKRKWNLYLTLLLFATFNKETTILLIIIFYFYYKNSLAQNEFRRLLLIQILIFILVKSILYFMFYNNPGTFVEFHLFDHNLRLIKNYNLNDLVTFIVCILLIFYGWKDRDQFLKISFAMIIPLLFLALFLGYLDELRGYYEVLPVITIFVYVNILKFLGVEVVPKIQSEK